MKPAATLVDSLLIVKRNLCFDVEKNSHAQRAIPDSGFKKTRMPG